MNYRGVPRQVRVMSAVVRLGKDGIMNLGQARLGKLRPVEVRT